ncbi:putative tubby-like protein [Helianthus anomalus]
MPKVYPKTVVIPALVSSDNKQRFINESSTTGRNLNPEILTVWKKSLLFNCYGFTVFDTKGNLVFRVDNYAAGNKAEIVLMDASGRSLLTIRRKVIEEGSIENSKTNKLNFGHTFIL